MRQQICVNVSANFRCVPSINRSRLSKIANWLIFIVSNLRPNLLPQLARIDIETPRIRSKVHAHSLLFALTLRQLTLLLTQSNF
jgi:hypothetical protein